MMLFLQFCLPNEGQSMGGAITLLSTAVDGPLKDVVKGVVLLAPMCKIAKEMMFPNWVVSIRDTRRTRGITRRTKRKEQEDE